MPPQESRSEHGDAHEADRHAIRRLVAALADTRISPPQLRDLMHDAPSVDALIETALADPARLKSLYDTGLLERPDPELDKTAMLTAIALGTPFAAVSLISRDCHLLAGCHLRDTVIDRSLPLEASLCKFAVATGELFIVDDTRNHPLVADNPLVRSGDIRSYAGIPIADSNDNVVGALAAWDDRPRRWSAGQIQVLTSFSSIAAARIFNRPR